MHAERETIDMKHTKQDFNLNAWMDLGDGQGQNYKLFSRIWSCYISN